MNARMYECMNVWVYDCMKNRHEDPDDRWALHQFTDFRQESRRDIRQGTGNEPACQQHHSKLFQSVETAEIQPTITFHEWRKNIGPFPHIKSCRLMQQYLSRCHKRCRKKTAIHPQRCSQADLKQEEVWPYHSCAEESAPLASHPSAYRLQLCGLCLQRPQRSRSDIPQLHLQSCSRGRLQGSTAFCSSRRSDCASNQDPSLWAKKLPCIRTGCLELIAWRHSNPGTVAGALQNLVENTFILPSICQAALIALSWLGWKAPNWSVVHLHLYIYIYIYVWMYECMNVWMY